MLAPQIVVNGCRMRCRQRRQAAVRLALAIAVCAATSAAPAMSAFAQAAGSRPVGGELIGENEAGKIDEIVALNLKPYSPESGAARRDQHPKHHGLVRAKFVIRDDIPAALRHGIFAAAKTYDAAIRFSNGREYDDSTPDAHGMAIKLAGVSGPKLQAGADVASTHDFILVDSETFFLKDIDELLDFNRDVSAAKLNSLWRVYLLAKFMIWRRDLGGRLFAFAGKTISSPLATNYWSAVPYRLGNAAVKYVVRSPLADDEGAGTAPTARDGLAAALAAQLRARAITLQFGVFVQNDPLRQPIEDATVSWRENGARYVALAEIRLPRQDVDPKSAAAEDVAFSPWNVAAQHRPLGGINRARRAVYRAMRARRHRTNNVDPAQSLAMPH